jgi:AcrR family transcriptional regulator
VASVPGAAGRRRTRLDAGDRRDQIVAAARRVFAQRPYAEVSVTELAQAAGTTRTNLHHYFRDKRTLYLEVLRRFGRLPDPLPWGGDGQDTDLDELFDQWLGVLEAHPQQILTLVRAVGPGGDPEIAAVLEQGNRVWQDRLISALELTDDPGTRARLRAFQGMAAVVVVEWLDRGNLTRDSAHRLLTNALLVALDRMPSSSEPR